MTSSRYYSGPVSDHFDGRRFFNPDHPSTDRSLRELLRWRMCNRIVPWGERPVVTPVKPEASIPGCRATMVGHATVLIQAGGLNVLTDPVWSARASPFTFIGPKRVTAPGIRFGDLPRIDVVLLSHNHYDHFDVATLKRLQARDKPRFITALGNDRLLKRHLPDAEVAAGDWGACFAVGDSAKVHIVPAQHWSARGLDDRREALWCGFMLRAGERLIYFAGDTGYGNGAIFRKMRESYGAPDLALIPIGAYEPRWFMSAQHIDPEEAVKILLDQGARRAMGIHWGTFQLTGEPRQEPALRLAAELKAQSIDGARMIAARPGDSLDV